MKIICPEHGAFYQSPHSHKQGDGCPSCSVCGFNNQLEGILYYIRINKNGQEVYKIGITNYSVKQRFSVNELLHITIIKEIIYAVGSEARNMESQILKDYSFAKYKGEPLLVNGNSELFKYDILGLDTSALFVQGDFNLSHSQVDESNQEQ